MLDGSFFDTTWRIFCATWLDFMRHLAQWKLLQIH